MKELKDRQENRSIRRCTSKCALQQLGALIWIFRKLFSRKSKKANFFYKLILTDIPRVGLSMSIWRKSLKTTGSPGIHNIKFLAEFPAYFCRTKRVHPIYKSSHAKFHNVKSTCTCSRAKKLLLPLPPSADIALDGGEGGTWTPQLRSITNITRVYSIWVRRGWPKNVRRFR